MGKGAHYESRQDGQPGGREAAPRNDSHDEESDDLDGHVAGSVSTGKAIPVPIRDVGRDGGEYSGNQNEPHSAGETRDGCLGEEKHGQDRFEQFGGEFGAQ